MTRPTPITDEPWFSRISRPSRYLGKEVHAIIKDPRGVEVSCALAFPEVYEIGMSHLGLKILYHLMNLEPWLAAERVFCPWTDMENALKTHGRTLQSLESGTPLAEFDVLGFSLQNELTWTNVLTMLDLSGIPLLAEERDARHPLVIAGGPACFNPEPMAAFFDLFVVGDGEEAAVEICRAVRKAKQHKTLARRELLLELCKIPGVYVPSIFDPIEGSNGRGPFLRPMVPGYDHVSKAVLPDLGIYPYPECQVVPFMELIHDRLAIEISRGCTRGCRFCQAGMIYRPVRERMPGALLQSALKSLRATGYEELSLLSLSSGDYTCIEPLLKALMDRLSREKTALSLPSLRVGSLSTAMMEEIKRVRKTGFTLAVEAATPRLRAVINKRLTDEEVLEMAGEAYGSGWRLIKLYFMIGLPTETDEDLLAIARLSKRIARLSGRGGGRPRLNVSLSTFIPKPHTPFQWAPQISIDESKRRMALVQREIRGSTIQVKWNPPELSWLEGILSRGDRRLARVILKAWASGARFDAWSECFSRKIWETALSDAHVDPNEYLHRERSIHESLPWDHIRSGVSKDYLAEEWRKAREGLTTSDCREGCLECGVCDQVNVRPRLIEGPKEPLTASESGHGPSGAACIPYRIHFGKRGDARFLSHLELTRALVRAVRRCAMPVAYSSGFHPLPKIAFLSALPVGTESLDEMVDIEMTGTLDLSETLQRLRQELPQGIEIHALTPIDPRRAARRIKETRYRVWVPGAVLKQDALEGFLNSERFLVRKRTQKGERDVDARPLVSAVTLLAPDALEVVIAHGSGPELRPAEIVGRIFSLDESLQCHVRILKLNDVLIV